MKIIVVMIIILASVSYFMSKSGVPGKAPVWTLPTTISSEQAIENVKKLPEVQQYLKRVPSGKVEVDNELEGEYNIHIYEVINGHTATFNWYRVSLKSGEVRQEF
ncbi:hypothetical protein A2631_00765 [Candidatus Daviesbacteria bacterium RIFCSPHIGHO2_01_FULL_44_29]|uniref:Uncharacterized protein n=1 Tax=Candidatus Daviesbacteria bacterium RIFCSPHIGHO2_02_FULL_43_12 TaxID=1797776 RepID=A0A1F5KH60_9BACT|nr:MAG: hypothetical protein A2631_00765 [Candidatus Daviesbacteria bacterium RIFCSPHIGHO2_01_FULL_44_29]OGE39373.1 MAG: hypothetical protein A3E86_01625 [Candidatus Daviesbacteria bacterium RIFCSPHIGHO2_12_FULL_47_45]OGE40252.1 MAG: hypothetical protein A3D25_05230 [Candidatus Daviesbacteria bacterium RIFCSPHIGHO2_02_FULL_43_12]OGE69051.1 MAG: hypothetical protein A3B55_02310 [Candidatus Daviesbacteria bacterium RIFCSPLOWO2_01_FULL_43_15]